MLNIMKAITEYTDDHNQQLKMMKEWMDEGAELRKRKFRKLHEQRYILGQAGKLMEMVKQEIDSNNVKIKQMTAKKNNNGYLFVTINPKKEIKLDRFLTIIKKLSSRAFVDEYMYVIEQRGSDEKEIGKGIHCHILIKRDLNYKPSKCCKYLKNGCKKIVGNIQNDHQVNIKIIGEDFAKDKIEYMVGEKTGEGKDKKQQMDKIFRKNNKLEKYYGEIKSLV